MQPMRKIQIKRYSRSIKFPKSTYMYWQKRFDKENANVALENKILEIRKDHKDLGYRRIFGEIRKLELIINKKIIQRLIQKLNLQVKSFARRSRKYSLYKGTVGVIDKNGINRRFST